MLGGIGALRIRSIYLMSEEGARNLSLDSVRTVVLQDVEHHAETVEQFHSVVVPL